MQKIKFPSSSSISHCQIYVFLIYIRYVNEIYIRSIKLIYIYQKYKSDIYLTVEHTQREESVHGYHAVDMSSTI